MTESCEHAFVWLRQELREDGYDYYRVYDVFFCSKCLGYEFVEIELRVGGRRHRGSGRRFTLKELP